jgi:hypothetical protein
MVIVYAVLAETENEADVVTPPAPPALPQYVDDLPLIPPPPPATTRYSTDGGVPTCVVIELLDELDAPLPILLVA